MEKFGIINVKNSRNLIIWQSNKEIIEQAGNLNDIVSQLLTFQLLKMDKSKIWRRNIICLKISTSEELNKKKCLSYIDTSVNPLNGNVKMNA